jgi:hypothetical protein
MKVLDRGLLFNRNNAEIYYRYTVYLLNSGKHKKAVEVLEKPLNMNYAKHSLIFEDDSKLKNKFNIIEIIELHKPDKKKIYKKS